MKFDAVLMIAFGGPTRFEEVRPFLDNVLKGHPVPPSRVEQVVEQYRMMGGRSPMNDLTFRQARALEDRLRANGSRLPVYVGMRNWAPYLADALRDAVSKGHRRLFGIVMASHRTEASWERYLQSVQDATHEVGDGIDIEFAGPWHVDERFVESVADRARGVLRELPPEGKGTTQVIFTAHSVPVPMAQASGYDHQINETARLVAEKLGNVRWSIAYQSRSGRPTDPWLEPDVGAHIEKMAVEGVKRVVFIPVGFLVDHVEVLFDLDVKAREVAERLGIGFHRVPTVSDHPLFIAMLAEYVQQASA
ncbi:MAG: ferrochelatase [Nitrospirae bacterium]|nr:ferrochelatase [Nitrospirota bacterium]